MKANKVFFLLLTRARLLNWIGLNWHVRIRIRRTRTRTRRGKGASIHRFFFHVRVVFFLLLCLPSFSEVVKPVMMMMIYICSCVCRLDRYIGIYKQNTERVLASRVLKRKKIKKRGTATTPKKGERERTSVLGGDIKILGREEEAMGKKRKLRERRDERGMER